MRSLSLPVPISRSQVHLTSAAVKGLPSCHLTPWRSGKVSSLPSSLHSHFRRQIGDDRLQAVLRDVLVVHHEVVEHPHHRLLGGTRRFLEDRHAGRAVEMLEPEDAARFLRQRRPCAMPPRDQRPP